MVMPSHEIYPFPKKRWVRLTMNQPYQTYDD